MAGKPPLPARRPSYVTPILPDAVYKEIREWERLQHQPALVLAFDHEYKKQCPHCGGGGILYVKFCKRGPLPFLGSLKEVSTWFDGNHLFGKGWYIVDHTLAYVCTHPGVTQEWA